MSTLSRLWKNVSRIGTKGVFDERLRFEVITINQLSVLAFVFSLVGTVPNLINSPFGPTHVVVIVYTLIFLLPLYWNSLGWRTAAKLTPLISVSIYCLLIGLSFGLDSQAHTIFMILIAFAVLFFYRQPRWFQVSVLLPLIALPITLLILNVNGQLPLLDPGIPYPLHFGITNFVLTALISIVLFNLIIKNFRNLIKEINEKRFSLLNEYARSKGTAQELESKVQAIVHDLKSPITSALGLMQIIDSAIDENERSQSLQFLQQSLHRMKSQVDSVMEERAGFDREKELQAVDVEEELQEILNMISHYPGYNRVRMAIEIEQEQPLVTDQSCLRVILSNVLSNSIKYMDDRKATPQIHIKGFVSADKGTITIQDNGIGIEKSHLPLIFNKSYRATDRAEGHGLGLALVKKALELLDGDIRIESEVQEGTTVQIHLPNHRITNRIGIKKEASLN